MSVPHLTLESDQASQSIVGALEPGALEGFVEYAM